MTCGSDHAVTPMPPAHRLMPSLILLGNLKTDMVSVEAGGATKASWGRE